MDEETLRAVNTYCYTSYRDTLSVQLYLAEYFVPISYSDNISVSELNFILDIVKEINEKKNSL